MVADVIKALPVTMILPELFQIVFPVVASTIPHLREDRISDFKIPLIENQTEIIALTSKAFELKDKRKKLIAESRILLENSLDF